MRVFLFAVATLGFGAGATFAQTPVPILSPLRLYDSGVVDCMQMWDSGTHMTKHEWSRACTRVQTRLDGLDVDAIMSVKKAQR
jgi:hypothetical protein